jgi:hypothetical protein
MKFNFGNMQQLGRKFLGNTDLTRSLGLGLLSQQPQRVPFNSLTSGIGAGVNLYNAIQERDYQRGRQKKLDDLQFSANRRENINALSKVQQRIAALKAYGVTVPNTLLQLERELSKNLGMDLEKTSSENFAASGTQQNLASPLPLSAPNQAVSSDPAETAEMMLSPNPMPTPMAKTAVDAPYDPNNPSPEFAAWKREEFEIKRRNAQAQALAELGVVSGPMQIAPPEPETVTLYSGSTGIPRKFTLNDARKAVNNGWVQKPKSGGSKLEGMTRAQAAATIAHYKGMNKPFSELGVSAQEKLKMARYVMETPKYQRDPYTGSWVAIAQNLPKGVQEWFDATTPSAGQDATTPSAGQDATTPSAGQSGVVPQASDPNQDFKVQVIQEGQKAKKRTKKIARIDDQLREGISMLRRGMATSGPRGLVDDLVTGVSGYTEELFTGMPSAASGNDRFREIVDILANDLLPEINPDERFTETDVKQIRKIAGELRLETRAGQILSRLERLARIMGTDLSGLGFDSAEPAYELTPEAQRLVNKVQQEQNR